MTKDKLAELHREILQAASRQKALGGYSTDAETILTLMLWHLQVIDHLLGPAPKKKKK